MRAELTELAEAFSAELIPNYASRRAYTRWRGKTHEHAYYEEPITGIHLCGADINDAAATAACYPMTEKQARDAFTLARAEAECDQSERDFVVDLFINGSVGDDFYTNRQLWPKAVASWNAALRALGMDEKG